MNVSRGPLPPRMAARLYESGALRGLGVEVGEKLLSRSRPLDSDQLRLYSRAPTHTL